MTDTPLFDALLYTAFDVADAAVISLVEDEGTPIGPGADRRWDISAMFNPDEHCPESIDIAERDVGYALGRGLLLLESGRPVVVRILQPLGTPNGVTA